MQTALSKDSKYKLSKVLTSVGTATDPQFQAIRYTNSEVYTPHGARKPLADVAELVDAHV